MFAEEQEAVADAAVKAAIGARFSPVHGLLDAHAPEGHVHSEIGYRIVGRLPPTGTPWDRAILVPIESVWEVHGLGNGHPDGVERVGPPWEQPAGVPAIVVKPRSFAGAYQLRARYRTASSTAVFPCEVLAGLFRTLGDVRSVLSWMSIATSALVLAVLLAFASLTAGRAREHAVLRAVGAPPAFIVGALWLELGVILLGGVAAGVLLGWGAAALAGAVLSRATGVAVPVALGVPELWLALATFGCALAASAVPAIAGGWSARGAALKR